MQSKEYEIMFNMEERHWWYIGTHKIFLTMLEKIIAQQDNNNLTVLDAGCGTGKMLKILENFGFTTGLDFSEVAIDFCEKRGLRNVIKGSIMELPFSDNSFDIVTCFDVLYHLNVDNDDKALRELFRVCKPGGVVLINVPAWNYLKSSHDVAIQTRKRYSKNELRYKVMNAGFFINKITHINFFLFPIAIVTRIINKYFMHSKKLKSDLTMPNSMLNSIFSNILCFEAFLLKYIDLPIGLSVFCIASKKRQQY